ncbi:MAG TPA: DUF2799 domain-containing protein [Thermohalobaculum sp.]|nr:DUF2799 domain-containing protein [Thermohalobaculum sp.]
MRLAATCVLLAVAGLGLGACASVSPAERAALCQTVDWHDYGRNDGLLGIPEAERTELIAVCRELGHAPDVAAYRDGRATGLAKYCTVERGYEAGRAGRRYRDVCPPDLAIGFLQGHAEGRRDRGRDYRAEPRFAFGLGFGHFRPRHHWWFGHRHGW